MTAHSDATEATPLLDVDQTRKTSQTTSKWRFQATAPRTIVILISLLIVILATGGGLLIVPTTRLVEDILCHRFYGDITGLTGPIDEKLCKDDSIQSELAYITGMITTMEALAGFIFAFPFGILADKIGRKPVFLISMSGTILYILANFAVLRFWRVIPIHLIVFTPLFEFIGGGTPLLLAILYSIAADVESDANRASAFFLMALAAFVGNLLGPLLSSKLMETSSPWVPLTLVLIVLPLGTSIIFFIPETLKVKPASEDDIIEENQSFIASAKLHLQHTFAQLLESFAMLKSPPLAIILLTFLITMPTVLGKSQFFLQYFSKRFDWPLAKTGYLLSVRGIVSVFVLLVALPGVSKLLLSNRLPFQFTAAKKDLFLAQTSAIIGMFGFILLGGPSVSIVFIGIIVATLGDGLAPLSRSLLPAFIDAQHTSRLYTLVGLVEAVGTMYAGPGLAWFFTKGMKLKGLWLGLPYFWVAGLCALVAIAFGFVDLEATFVKPEDDVVEDPVLGRDDETIETA